MTIVRRLGRPSMQGMEWSWVIRRMVLSGNCKSGRQQGVLGTRKSKQTFSGQRLSRCLRIMDVRNQSRGRPHRKVRFPAALVVGRSPFEPWASGRKGQECPLEIRTKKFKFMLFFWFS